MPKYLVANRQLPMLIITPKPCLDQCVEDGHREAPDHLPLCVAVAPAELCHAVAALVPVSVENRKGYILLF